MQDKCWGSRYAKWYIPQHDTYIPATSSQGEHCVMHTYPTIPIQSSYPKKKKKTIPIQSSYISTLNPPSFHLYIRKSLPFNQTEILYSMASVMFLQISFLAMMMMLYLVIGPSQAFNYYVGGKDGWSLNPSKSFNDWASQNRFQVHDSLGNLFLFFLISFLFYLYLCELPTWFCSFQVQKCNRFGSSSEPRRLQHMQHK